MSDVAATEAEEPSSKRVVKMSSKGMEYIVIRYQEKRSAKCKQAKRCMEHMSALMASIQNVDSVKNELAVFMQCYQDANETHTSFMSLPLPKDEVERQGKYFLEKMTMFCDFTDNVKGWLFEAGHPYVETNKDDPDNQCVADGIHPEDSASNVASIKSSSLRSHSRLSRSSSISSARIKAEADKAALVERIAAQKRKHQIEAQQEKLRREKEQLELETELAATKAKLQVWEIRSQCGSKHSNGMNSYFERNNSHGASELNPHANTFVPDKMNKKDHALGLSAPELQPPVVKPKQKQMDEMTLKVEAPVHVMQTVNGTQMGHAHHQTALTDNHQNDIVNIMQRQNDIAALLVQQNLCSNLPSRNIPVFDGDPLQYRSFIRAFENGVEEKTDNWSDCLHFLEQYTRGQPKDLVHSCQHLPSEQGYHRAKSLLAEHFGNEHKIAAAYMEKILTWTPVKSEDIKGLQSFSLFLRGCSNLTEQLMNMKELDLPSNMRSIIVKLPYKLRERWRNVACDLQERRGNRAMFADLVGFIERQVKIASDPVFGNIQDPQLTNSKASTVSHFKQRKKGSSFATNVTTVKDGVITQHTGNKIKSSTLNCLFCSQVNHSMDQCSQFKMTVHRDKINFIKEKGICFGCLKKGHTSKYCRSRLDCNVCHQKHPSVLHIERQDKATPSDQQSVSSSNVSPAVFQTCGHIGAGQEDASIFSIVAVKVKSQRSNKTVQTYAFLDPGSSGTFCTENLARKLNVRGKRTSILLRTMGQKKIVNAHVLSGLEVSDLNMNDFIELPDVLTQKNMPVSSLNIPRQEDVDQWSYLKAVQLHDIEEGVDLLIGTDAPKVMEPWELINSQDEGPYAVRTRVGWVINGPLRGGSNKNKSDCSAVTSNRISVEHLQEMLVKQFNHDFNERSSDEQIEMSREDVKFMNVMNNTTKLIGSHYCIDLPFRQENPLMPNNRHVAEQRLQSLKRKFAKNGQFKGEYITFLNNMVAQGYAEVVPSDQLKQSDGNVWYIPHHGVYHPRKGKLRVVFDCGAAYKGTSLNCQLLQGPDFTNSLVGVLVRFRQEPVAVMADIQAMYHQVHVSEKHINFLRFLWWPGGDVSQAPVEHRMKVHLFGAVSSPSCANYALRRTADDNAEHFPHEVVNTVKCNFYVDDCLKSVASEEVAVQVVKDVTALCHKGGFNLSKWISNSRTVLLSIAEDCRAKEVMELDLDVDQLPMERALGLQWCIETDKFKFRTSVQEQPQTRRGILSVVSSLYDPLGFLSPLTIPAKLLLQELCRRSLGWDEAIPHSLSKKWFEWLEDLQKVAEFNVDRCMKPRDFGDPATAQLHHFSDASQVGYGTVSYLRLEKDDSVQVSFLLGKARVAPLKQTTIPRLELTAAVLAVRFDKMLQKELQLKLEKSVFWTDSTTVLKYICNETRRFQTFVANSLLHQRSIRY